MKNKVIKTSPDITEPKQAEQELRKIQGSTQKFNEKLHILHEVTNELTKTRSTDELCRLAVELGHKKLGFPRIGIWMKGSEPGYQCGTYGIDENGNIRDERDLRFKVKQQQEDRWKYIFFGHEEIIIEYDCQLQDAQGITVGKGSRMSVRIWDGKDSIGIIFVDDLLEPGSISDQQIMIIKSFASTVGHLYSQKCVEEELIKSQQVTQQFNEKLHVLHEVTNELTNAGSTDEVCRLAVELGHKKLGFPRIGIWLKGPVSDYTHGTFGIDENGNICDERDLGFKVKGLKDVSWKSVFYGHRELIIEHDCQLQDAQGITVGKGSRVTARIWDGKNSLGIIFVDDLSEPGAITDRLITITESFASTVGHLYSQKRAEEELGLFARTLTEKNTELEKIMNIAAHDLRTPLVNIKGFGDLLVDNLKRLRSIIDQSKVPDNLKNELETIFTEDVYQNLKFIRTGTEMLDSLLKALLRLARLGRATVDFQKLNINEMMSDIAGSIKHHLDTKNVKLTIEHLPSCYGDKGLVGEVFLNLLSNAIKYLDPSRPGLITLCAVIKRDRVVYCVRDNGFGIDPESQKHVFDIFYRIRHGELDEDGEGLGLTIVRSIMDMHDGKVRLESEKGIGSKFYVSFPAAKKRLSKRILDIKKGIVPSGTIPRQESYR